MTLAAAELLALRCKRLEVSISHLLTAAVAVSLAETSRSNLAAEFLATTDLERRRQALITVRNTGHLPAIPARAPQLSSRSSQVVRRTNHKTTHSKCLAPRARAALLLFLGVSPHTKLSRSGFSQPAQLQRSLRASLRPNPWSKDSKRS